VRDRAVKVAGQNCSLSVMDHLTIRPNIASASTRLPVEQLHAAVVSALKDAFPRQSANMGVQCRPYGQVVLSGAVSSFEEKLAVSTCLRRLPGCTSVVSLLNISEVAQVPPTDRRNGLPMAYDSPYNSRPAASNPTAAWSGAPAGNATAQSRSQSAYQNAWPTTTRSPYDSTPVSPTQAARPQGSGQPGTALTLAPAPSSTNTQRPESNGGVVQASSCIFNSAAPQAGTNNKVVQASSNTVAGSMPQAGANSGVVPAQHLAWAGQADNVRQVSNVVRGPAAGSKVPPPGEPYVTNGVVYVSERVAAKPAMVPSAVVPPAPPQKTPLQAIHAACPGARNVEVVVRSPREILVRLQAANKTEADRFANIILGLPELAAYHKDLEIRAAP
jgi:hypothetical protein